MKRKECQNTVVQLFGRSVLLENLERDGFMAVLRNTATVTASATGTVVAVSAATLRILPNRFAHHTAYVHVRIMIKLVR